MAGTFQTLSKGAVTPELPLGFLLNCWGTTANI